jgi:hypothetical protein
VDAVVYARVDDLFDDVVGAVERPVRMTGRAGERDRQVLGAEEVGNGVRVCPCYAPVRLVDSSGLLTFENGGFQERATLSFATNRCDI